MPRDDYKETSKMTDNESLLEKISRQSMSKIVGRLLRFHDADYKYQFEQELNRVKISYETTPEGYAKDILLGTYKLLADKWEHLYGHKFDNALHRRIQRDILDRAEITRWHKKRILGESAK
jgi:hypothetical protein